MFQRRPDTDSVGERFENRLIRIESYRNEDDEEDTADDKDTASNTAATWLEKFDMAFQRGMVRDVETVVGTSESPSKIKIKAALGYTRFELPNASTACRLYTWQQLQQLELHKDFSRRWENTCNMRSNTVSTLMHTLQARIPRDVSYEAALTVYLGFDGDASIRDFSVKFLWTSGQWTPVTSRCPTRESHGLYNISLDNETAFRVRVYSREYPSNWETHTNMWEEIEFVPHRSGDPLRTEVKLRRGHSRGLFICRVWLREKTQVDYEGIRFSISFNDAGHTDANAIIQCQVEPSDGSTLEPTHQLRDLLDKMLAVLSRGIHIAS